MDIKELKSELLALAVSSRTEVDLLTLQRDYRFMMGTHIPVKKWGYRMVLPFIKDYCSDIFVIHGFSCNPKLTVIVPEYMKHLFVQKQKVPTETEIKETESTNHHNCVKPGDRQPAELAEVATTERSNSELHKTSQSTNHHNCVKPGDRQPAELAEVAATERSDSELHKTSQSTNHHNCVEPGDRQPAELTEVATTEPSDSELLETSRNSLRERLHQLAGELLKLLQAHERGVLVTDLEELYWRYFGRMLSHSFFGFYSLRNLLWLLDERVIIDREPDGLYLRLDPSAPPSPRPSPRPTITPPQSPSPTPHRDEPLPVTPPATQVFPSDSMQLLEAIPRQQLSGVYPGSMLPVEVVEVHSPSHIWLKRLGAAHSDALDTLMDEMKQYYIHGEGKSRELARAATLVGQYCAALYEGLWHRALIVKVLSTKEVKVRYVDYGTVSRVSAGSLKPLLRRYAGLAAQAVRARLARVRPAAAARRWDPSAALHLFSLVDGRHLCAKVVAADQEEVVLETLLIDESGEADVCLSAELVRAGYADRRAGSAQGSGESYLLPRWEPLEAGDALSLDGILRYQAAGIELDSVQPYSRHVASLLPPRQPELPPHQPGMGPRHIELPLHQSGLAPRQHELAPYQPSLAPRQLEPAPYQHELVAHAISVPMECQTGAVPEPCVLCRWAASFLDPILKDIFDYYCTRSPDSHGIGTHRFITGLIVIGAIRPAPHVPRGPDLY